MEFVIETDVPDLDPDTLYEACPDCFDRDPISEGLCLRCFDEQIVPHNCAWGE